MKIKRYYLTIKINSIGKYNSRGKFIFRLAQNFSKKNLNEN